MASLKKNILYNASYRVFQIVIPLVITPYLSRTLGAGGVGLFSYTSSISAYFILFAMLGISTHGVRAIASVSDGGKVALSKSFWNIYSIQLCTGLVAFATYLIYCISDVDNFSISILWLPSVASALIDVSWFVFGMGEFKMPTIRNYVMQVLSTCLVFLLVKDSSDVWIYIVVSSVNAFISQLCLMPYLIRRVKVIHPDFRCVISNLRSCLLLFLPVAAISVYTTIDKVMLGSMVGMDEAGFYTYADKIVSVFTAILVAFGSVMLPKMTSLFSEGKGNQAFDLLRLSMSGMQMLAWGISLGIIAISQELVPVFLGEQFIPSIIPLIVISLKLPFVAATNVLGNQYLIPLGKDKAYTASVFVGAAVNVAINVVAIPLWGCVGAAFGTVMAEFAVFCFQTLFLHGELPIVEYLKESLPFIAASAILFIVIKVVGRIVMLLLPVAPLCLVLEIVFGAAIYGAELILLVRIFKNKQISELIGLFSPKLEKKIAGSC